jgi:hypothetical protein
VREALERRDIISAERTEREAPRAEFHESMIAGSRDSAARYSANGCGSAPEATFHR